MLARGRMLRRKGALSDRARRGVMIAACVVIGGAGVAVFLFQLLGGRDTETGIPRKELTRFTLTCVNPECPGRHDETDLYGQLVRGVPYTFDRELPGGYTDWPVPCPKCVERFGPEYLCRIDGAQFEQKYHHGLGQTEYTGRSAFHISTCGECGTKWVLWDATRKAGFKCPGCGSNIAQ